MEHQGISCTKTQRTIDYAGIKSEFIMTLMVIKTIAFLAQTEKVFELRPNLP